METLTATDVANLFFGLRSLFFFSVAYDSSCIQVSYSYIHTGQLCFLIPIPSHPNLVLPVHSSFMVL